MDLSTFFDAFTSEDSTVFMVFNIIFFLFGFILAWILWGGRVRRLRNELKTVQDKAYGTEAELTVAREQIEANKKTLLEWKKNTDQAKGDLQTLQLAHDRLRTQCRALEEKNGQLNEMVESYESNIEVLNEQIVGLRTQNTLLSSEQQQGTSLSEDAVDGLAEMQSSYNATIRRMAAFEEKLQQLENDNQSLRSEIDDIKGGGAPLELGAIAVEQPASVEDDATESEDAAKQAARLDVQAAIGTKIPKAKAKHQDDLKLINGIGPFIENQLNEIGIYTYEQVASFDKELIERITIAIGFFPGRILRDDWVGQAGRLAEIKEEHPDALISQAVFPNKPSDLKIVEGIGPKIEKVLKKAGIKTWSELAGTNPDDLKEILLQAGDRYRMHTPTTWPVQAQLALDGEWARLKEYQDYLKGGREE
ncbi:MAG: hypothetical protein KDC34_08435 [Saprospiraceae bacterium]|nr:hypothetical protein [Saprospiraceae bacterium]